MKSLLVSGALVCTLILLVIFPQSHCTQCQEFCESLRGSRGDVEFEYNCSHTVSSYSNCTSQCGNCSECIDRTWYCCKINSTCNSTEVQLRQYRPRPRPVVIVRPVRPVVVVRRRGGYGYVTPLYVWWILLGIGCGLVLLVCICIVVYMMLIYNRRQQAVVVEETRYSTAPDAYPSQEPATQQDQVYSPPPPQYHIG